MELKKASNLELKNEIERRIKLGEWRIETHMEDTDEPVYFKVIDGFSFKNENKEEGFLEVSSLLGEQEEKDNAKEEEEIKKDNSRIKDWEKMESLINFSIEEKGGWGSKNLVLECKQCGKMDEHVYLDWSKWKKTNDIRVSSILSMIEYKWEAHVVQGHNSSSRAWTEERQKFPKYDEWLKSRNEDLWKARQMNRIW